MKRILIFLTVIMLFMTGCNKYSEDGVVKDLDKKINKSDGYKLSGELEITNNDEVYNYNVEVSYKADHYYKVALTNVSNDHTQVILKNDDGVYILTPALNKSFKFQSDWPYSNSQIYLLSALVNDIKNDKERTFKKTENGYVFTTIVNYPNNKNLATQKIELNKSLKIKNVKVYDDNNAICMDMSFKDIDFSPTFKKNYFELDTVMKTFEDNSIEVKETSNLDESIYPLFLPTGTKLANEEKIKKDIGERIIMTFDGEKPFLLVEETANIEEEFTVIPTYGEPYRLMDTLGVMTNNSLSWASNGIEYYIVSDVLSQDELVEIAQSINVLPSMK